MLVFLKAKDLAFLGVLMALAVLLVILGGYFEGSTLFFLAAASFLTGVAQRCVSFPVAAAFLAGTTLLDLILAPQKLYCATFLAFSVYVLAAEGIERRFQSGDKKKGQILSWLFKACVYHVLLAAALFLVQRYLGIEALLTGRLLALFSKSRVVFCVVVLFLAEALWLVFDRAYFYFQGRYGARIERIRNEGFH